LRARGFDDKWIIWITDLLTSNQTYININGIPSPYFKCKKEIKQGDPISLFLFNIVADTLTKILSKGKELGYLEGLGNFNGNNIINLNFIDDTLMFLKQILK
jgi:Reverse transcriptase (RNA-dependent DNA polymerase)